MEQAMTDSTHRVSGKRYFHTFMSSPVGRLTLIASDAGLAAILWENDRPGRVRLPLDTERPDHPVLVETSRQLAEYFAGHRTSFELPLDPHGTPFQQKVWRALLTIPFGETRTYGQIAQQVGSAEAVRAVGAANGRNPLSIVAPCHRVIGASGALTGFAGGHVAKPYRLYL
jgi:methylated-DNA-[protein]-cysteine S-methyltransferase